MNDIANEYNFSEDLSIAEELLSKSTDEICRDAELDVTKVTNLDKNFDKETADTLYNYFQENELYINNVKWFEYKDAITDDNTLILSHGSRNGIQGSVRIVNQKASENGDNDFGAGFYCGEDINQAGMFVSNSDNSCLYIFKFDKSGLTPCQFYVRTDWMLAVSYFRNQISEYENHPVMKEILNRINSADYIIAPIADNRVFEIIDLFINEQLTDVQCAYALVSTHLGYQYVFKKPEILDRLTIMNKCYLCPVDKSMYEKDSEIESNVSLSKALLAKKKLPNTGKYITQIFS